MQWSCAILSSVFRPALLRHSTLYGKRHGFKKKRFVSEIRDLIFCTNLFETFLILTRTG